MDGDRARWALADAAGRTLSESAAHEIPSSGVRVARLEVPMGCVEPLAWLRAQGAGRRFYWSGREDGLEVATVGVADLQEGDAREGPAALQKRLAPLLSSAGPGARYYGGLRFDPEREPAGEWAGFGSYRFVLPRFEVRRSRSRGVSTLACNLVLPRDAERHGEMLEEVEGLSSPEGGVYPGEELPAPISRADIPNRAGWKENIERALSAFSEGRMDKLVLARRAEFGFEEDLDAALLAASLKAATPGCFHFYAEPEEGAAFVGASPERLFRREGRKVLSEAVAGTRPRGASEADDEELRDELLRSAKDQSEHSYVRISIKETLETMCEELEIDERASDMKLAGGRHLVSRIRGTLREGVTDAEVLAALHPTPAVGGYPKGEALEDIRALEPFDRGWYAGPIGWIGADGAEFAVGIRSGLVRGRTLALFSGAGIVAGSTHDGEWTEIEQKIGDFTRVFRLGPEHGSA